MMRKYYDSINKRLVYINEGASEDFWDQHWKREDLRKSVVATPHSWIAKITKKYLASGTEVLEGGCGLANHVWALQVSGYKARGLDFAPETVAALNSVVPELSVDLGDVRHLPYEDDRFDGYWSLGVIEHFWDGFDDIAMEMSRVIKPEGYLFLSFPVMSPLRKIRASHRRYSLLSNNFDEPKGFYQFALDKEIVLSIFENLGFEFIESKGLDGLKGLKSELNSPRIFQALYDSKSFLGRILRKSISESLAFLGCSHSILLVLKKK